MTKRSASVKGTSLCKDTLVSWVIHNLLPFFCIIKNQKFHLGLYVASIEIHFFRFDHSILICVECGLVQAGCARIHSAPASFGSEPSSHWHPLPRSSCKSLLRTVDMVGVPWDRALERCVQRDCLPLCKAWGEKRADRQALRLLMMMNRIQAAPRQD